MGGGREVGAARTEGAELRSVWGNGRRRLFHPEPQQSRSAPIVIIILIKFIRERFGL